MIDRAALGRAITLIESTRPEHRSEAEQLLASLPEGEARRIGITGVPGAGKSTFIEAFGLYLIEQGLTVAVLAIDPSSLISGGSILGDKTRMQRLANHTSAFVRPSPTSGTLGGVAQRTYETMLLLERFGFDVVIVESVGVGQSEAALASMVDYFVLLMLAGAGDDLQAIKRGVLEVVDLVCINKADGDRLKEAQRALAELRSPLQLLNTDADTRLTSGLEGTGLAEVWKLAQAAPDRRAEQRVAWMRRIVRERLDAAFADATSANRDAVEARVRDGVQTPAQGADELLRLFRSRS